jgi:cellulose synthase (UDP-forming)
MTPFAQGAMLPSSPINLGIYDPDGRLGHAADIKIEHIFLSWVDYHPGDLLRQLVAIQRKRRQPLVTIEPWVDPKITSLSSSLLSDVLAGKYDQTIRALAVDISEFRRQVYLRWGHEMENVTGRYPWAVHNAQQYQSAYRHFVTLCRGYAHNISFVWSPVGQGGCERYYPGSTFVDYVGLSLFEFPEFDRGYYHKVRSFREQMAEKYGRVAHYGKPVIIAEFGVTGDDNFRLAWIKDAFHDMKHYPLLKAVTYFQAKDTPGAWGRWYPTPDWRISPQFLSATSELVESPSS